MEIMLLYLPVLIFPLLIFGWVGFKAKKWIFTRQYKRLILYGIVFLALGPMLAVLEVQFFFGGFGPGAMFYIIAPAMAVVLCLLFIFFAVKSRRNPGFGQGISIFSVIFVVLLPVLFSLIPLEMNVFADQCDMRNRQEAELVVKGLQNYHKDYSTYPKSVNDLIPNFLPNAPKLQCPNLISIVIAPPTSSSSVFRLGKCQEKTINLLMPSTLGIRSYVYDLEKGDYFLYDFLDGGCDF